MSYGETPRSTWMAHIGIVDAESVLEGDLHAETQDSVFSDAVPFCLQQVLHSKVF